MASSQPRTADWTITGATWAKGMRMEIYEHVFSDLRHEVGGFLLGDRGEHGKLLVRDFVPAASADGRTASVTFTQDDWAEVHAYIERRGGDDQIIGWYHSHPGFGIFLSEFDLFIHRNFFSDPGQIAYVIDPHAGREGLFGWRDGAVELLVESDTSRPAERPEPPAVGVEHQTRRWQPKHYLPAIGAGLVIGVGGAYAVFGGGGGGNATAVRPHATSAHKRAPAKIQHPTRAPHGGGHTRGR